MIIRNAVKGDKQQLEIRDRKYSNKRYIASGKDNSGSELLLKRFHLKENEQLVWARRVWAAGTLENGYLVLTNRRLAFIPNRDGSREFSSDIVDIRSISAVAPKMTKSEIALSVGAGLWMPGLPLVYYGAKRLFTKVISIITTEGKERRFTGSAKTASGEWLDETELVEEIHENLRILREHRKNEIKTKKAKKIEEILQRSKQRQEASDTPSTSIDADSLPEVVKAESLTQSPPEFTMSHHRRAYRRGILAAHAGEPRESPYTSKTIRDIWEQGYDSVVDTQERGSTADQSPTDKTVTATSQPLTTRIDERDSQEWDESDRLIQYPLEITKLSHRGVYRKGVLAAQAGELRESPYASETARDIWEQGYDSVGKGDKSAKDEDFTIQYPPDITKLSHRGVYRKGVLAAQTGELRESPYASLAARDIWEQGYDSVKSKESYPT